MHSRNESHLVILDYTCQRFVQNLCIDVMWNRSVFSSSFISCHWSPRDLPSNLPCSPVSPLRLSSVVIAFIHSAILLSTCCVSGTEQKSGMLKNKIQPSSFEDLIGFIKQFMNLAASHLASRVVSKGYIQKERGF